MSRSVDAIAQRLSLRKPQHESLELLARLCDLIPLRKDQDVAAALSAVRQAFPSVQDFERAFPSLCFALATGVGKTRLMGAAIAWLYRERRLRHYFVLAPNLTIYDKLIRDFTPGTPKYVFQGLADFATNPPELVTGDNWDTGRVVRAPSVFDDDAAGVVINVFNIAKINTEVRGGARPRVKRLNEHIGQSYFDYLAGLSDLVLLMDESHRYRAAAGMQAINELQPVLGIELTATPQIERGSRSVPFRNVVYSYPLAHALRDGFVKEPAVATRANFDPAGLSEEALERLKLEDGIRLHETVKAELEAYAVRTGSPRVKPFVLVVAEDTTHAAALQARLTSPDFFGGRYADRVITVHSVLRGEEKEDTVQRLLAVEDPAEPTEIVIHVNMLKEGWDVTNLFTIIPLRAANSRTLVEQSIGRGLRLPYGRRTGVEAVDRLTIVAHDRFREIVDDANRSDSPIRFVPVFVGDGEVVEPGRVAITQPAPTDAIWAEPLPEAPPSEPVFSSAEERETAKAVVQLIDREFSSDAAPEALLRPERRSSLVGRVKEVITGPQYVLGTGDPASIERVVDRTVQALGARTIAMPRIIIVPTGEVRTGITDFDLEVSAIRFQPVEEEILVQHLHDHRRSMIGGGTDPDAETSTDGLALRLFIDLPDVSYDDHASLVHKLAGQLVAHLKGYLPDDSAVRNVLLFYRRQLTDLLHAQLREHFWEEAAGYEPRVSRGFERLRAQSATAASSEAPREVRVRPDRVSDIRSMRFGPLRKSLYQETRFDSDPERALAALLEDAPEVLKWFRPSGPPPLIYWRENQAYEPDFVVETIDRKYLIEVKAADSMQDAEVIAKRSAAVIWCRHATAFAIANGVTGWTCVLVPDEAISAAATFRGLVTRFRCEGEPSSVGSPGS